MCARLLLFFKKTGERVLAAVVRARGADVATIEYEAIINILPIFFRYEGLEVMRYLCEVSVPCETEALREALHMRVCRYAVVLV